MNIKNIAFMQGISDWLRYKLRCPYVWRNTPEEKEWKRGIRFATAWNHG